MNRVVLSLGSNSTDCQTQMNNCVEWLKNRMRNLSVSSAYSTPALNRKDNDYLNAVAEGCVECDFETLKAQMKDYEKSSGRTPESKLMGVVPIDIDIVMWNDEVVKAGDYEQSYFKIGWNELKSK